MVVLGAVGVAAVVEVAIAAEVEVEAAAAGAGLAAVAAAVGVANHQSTVNLRSQNLPENLMTKSHYKAA